MKTKTLGIQRTRFMRKTLIMPLLFMLLITPAAMAASITIDPNAVESEVSPQLFGVIIEPHPWSFNSIWLDVTNNYNPTYLQPTKDLALQNLRMGGCAGEWYNWTQHTSNPFHGSCGGFETTSSLNSKFTLDRWAEYSQLLGAPLEITVGFGPSQTRYTAQSHADWVRYMNIQHNYNVTYWEMGNEVYSSAAWDAPADSEEYNDLARESCLAMKEVDPNVKCGAVLILTTYMPDTKGRPWNNYVIANSKGWADYFILHIYTPGTTYTTADFLENGYATVNVDTTPGANYTLKVWGRGQLCDRIADSAPNLILQWDGANILDTPVTSTWAQYSAPTTLTATKTSTPITTRFADDYYSEEYQCTKDLFVGALTLQETFRLAEMSDSEPSLTSAYHFNGDATDSSGGQNGDLNGGVNCAAPGLFKQACSFDGADDSITVPNNLNVDLDQNRDWSLSFWIRFSQPVNESSGIMLLSKADWQQTWKGWNIGINKDNYLTYSFGDGIQTKGGEITPNFGTTYNDGEWHNIALTYDSATKKAYRYVDATLQGSDSLAGLGDVPIAIPLTIGADKWNGRHYKGDMDGLAFFNTMLSQQDVTAINGLRSSRTVFFYNKMEWTLASYASYKEYEGLLDYVEGIMISENNALPIHVNEYANYYVPYTNYLPDAYYDFRGALVEALMNQNWIKDGFPRANRLGLSGDSFAHLLSDRWGGGIRSPLYWQLYLFTHYTGDKLLAQSASDMPAYNSKAFGYNLKAQTNTPYIQSVATTDGSKIYLNVINLHPSTPQPVVITILNASIKTEAVTHTLQSSDLDAHPKFGDVIGVVDVIETVTNPFTYSFEPSSLTVMELELTQPAAQEPPPEQPSPPPAGGGGGGGGGTPYTPPAANITANQTANITRQLNQTRQPKTWDAALETLKKAPEALINLIGRAIDSFGRTIDKIIARFLKLEAKKHE